MSTVIDGVDVSKWQGRIDWADAGKQLGFVMIKATQGVDEVDSQYAHNLDAARAAQIPRGSYHYPNAGDPHAEAAWYVRHAQRRNGEMQALDCEGVLLEHKNPVKWVHKWMHRVLHLSDNLPLIYMSGSTVEAFDWEPVIKLGCGLWVASWDARKPDPGRWPFVIMWQRDDDGKIHGIDGATDQDVFYGDQFTWAAYANNRGDGAAPMAPTPEPKKTTKPAEPEPASKPVTKPEPPAPAPVESAGPVLYIVRDGDNLTEIAHAHGVTVRELVAWNKDEHPSLTWSPGLIQPGWHLQVTQ